MHRSTKTDMYRSASPFTIACLAFALLVTTGCASGGGGGSSTRAPITAEDLVPGRFTDVVDAITKLRPAWMNRVEGVFVEGHQVRPEDLRLQPLEGIREIRLLRCDQATVRYPVNCVTETYLEITRSGR